MKLESRSWGAACRWETYQIGLPETFTGTKQLVTGGTSYNEVFGKVDTSNAVESANKRLPRCMIDSSEDWTDEPRTESSFVKTGGNQVGQSLGGNVALFSQSIHVDFVAESV